MTINTWNDCPICGRQLAEKANRLQCDLRPHHAYFIRFLDEKIIYESFLLSFEFTAWKYLIVRESGLVTFYNEDNNLINLPIETPTKYLCDYKLIKKLLSIS